MLMRGGQFEWLSHVGSIETFLYMYPYVSAQGTRLPSCALCFLVRGCAIFAYSGFFILVTFSVIWSVSMHVLNPMCHLMYPVVSHDVLYKVWVGFMCKTVFFGLVLHHHSHTNWSLYVEISLVSFHGLNDDTPLIISPSNSYVCCEGTQPCWNIPAKIPSLLVFPFPLNHRCSKIFSLTKKQFLRGISTYFCIGSC